MREFDSPSVLQVLDITYHRCDNGGRGYHMKIRLQFSSTSGVISRMIRWFTWSDVSHVDFLLPDGSLLGAQNDGVKIRPANYQKFSKIRVFEVDAPPEVFDWAVKQIGKPYDYECLFGFFVHKDFQEDSEWFCSEMVTAAFEHGGMPLLQTTNVDRISPRDLMLSPYLKPVK